VLGRGHSASINATTPAHTTTPRTRVPRPTAKQRAQANNAVRRDLLNAFTTEKVVFTDQQTYTASPSVLRADEPTIAWGTHMHITVADVATPGQDEVVCLSETTRYGDTFSLSDVAAGPTSGTYFGAKPCPVPLTARTATSVGREVG
jgi:hypothetical protein